MTLKQLQKNWEVKNRTYQLVGEFSPPLRQIRSKHSHTNHLMHWNEDKKEQEELRYYAAAKTPYVSGQPTENVQIEHIFFREGFLFTSRTDVALQQFLAIHPDNGRIFIELKPDADAVAEVVDFETRADAYEIVKKLQFEEIEAIMFDEIGDAVFKTSSKELKRDLWVIADEDPQYIINLVKTDVYISKFIAKKAEKFNIIAIADSGRTIRWTSNKHKICAVPLDETPYQSLATFFTTDDGVAAKTKIVEKLKAFD